MLRLGKILYLLIAVIAINGCKKDPKIDDSFKYTNQATGFNCGRSSFLDTVPVNLNSPVKICSSISGINNLYVATTGLSSLEVVKMDCDANFIWKKSYNYGTEKVVYVSALGKYDDFYVLTATDNFTPSGGIDTVKAWVSYSENTSSTTINCDRSVSAYVFNPSFIKDQSIKTLTNYSRLYKYDGAGNLQWQKNLSGNYYDNVGLSADTNSNIYVLTAERKTYAPFEVFTFTTSAYPCYAMPLDSNGFTVTKIDPFGNQTSSATINKVYTMNAGVFNPGLSASASNISIICDRDVYVFDVNLNSFNKVSPVSSNCVNKQIVPLNNPNIPHSVYYLKTYDGINNIYFTETYSGTSKLITNLFSDQQYVTLSPRMDVAENVYFIQTNFYSKYDAYRTKLYHKNLTFSPFSLTSLTSKLNQIFFFDYNNTGNLYIVKPDVNGNY